MKKTFVAFVLALLVCVGVFPVTFSSQIQASSTALQSSLQKMPQSPFTESQLKQIRELKASFFKSARTPEDVTKLMIGLQVAGVISADYDSCADCVGAAAASSDPCHYAVTHCSPCQHVVAFWCS